jgi:methylenetetrahydrofolate dehydrogenase (NADP+)/methenyltetrahydrofolate cyclohydrolase
MRGTPASAAPSATGARVIDGTALAKLIRAEVAADVVSMRQSGVTPGLTVVLVGDDAASAVYARRA